jgi:hypothetical protein
MGLLRRSIWLGGRFGRRNSEAEAKADPCGMTNKKTIAEAKVLEAGGEGVAEICG